MQPTNYRKEHPADWRERIARDTATAARLAVRARAESPAGPGARVFGCMPPLAESHRPDLAVAFLREHGREFAVAAYVGIADALQQGGPIDGFIIETASTLDDVECALEAVRDRGLPLIVSMEGALRSPDSLAPRPETAPAVAERVLALKAQGAPIEALGFNCAPPEVILQSLRALRVAGLDEKLRGAGVALAAYANIVDHGEGLGHDAGFDHEAVTARLAQEAQEGGGGGGGGHTRVREDMAGERYVDFCLRFLESGATYCGGCCESTPDQIRRLAARVRRAR